MKHDTMNNAINLSIFGIEVDAHNLFGAIPDLVCVLDIDMNIVYSNWQGIALCIPEQNRQINIKCYEALQGRDDVCPGCEIIDIVNKKKTIKSVQTFYAPGEDFQRLARICAIPILDNNNNVKYIINWSKDVTDISKSRLEAATQKALLRSTLDNFQDVVSIKKTNYEVELYNLAGHKVLDGISQTSGAKKCYEFLGRDKPCEICPTEKAVNEKRPVDEYKYIPELGRHFHCRVHPVLDDNGTVVRTVEHLRDITDQRKLETKLMREHENLEALMSNVPGIIFSCHLDEEWTMTYMSNNDVESITGYPATDFINNKVRSYKSIIYYKDVDYIKNAVYKSIRENKHWEIRYRIIHKDGYMKWVFEKGRPVIDNAGFINSLNGIIQDVTEHVELEEESKNKNLLMQYVVNNSRGYLWHKDKNHRYKFCDKDFKKHFFGLNDDPDISGYNDVELVELYKKRSGIRHDFGELCLSTDDHSRQMGKKSRYIEGGVIGSSLFVLEVIKTPLFDENNEYIGNIGFAWNRSDNLNLLDKTLTYLSKTGVAMPLLQNDWTISPFVYFLKEE